jgi:energy-coupling factor transporter ATP-binding protein EcfA2
VVVIDIRHLCKRYGSRRGIEDVSLQVEAGEIFGFLGPNGAGKTTTIRVLLGLLRPSGGTVRVFGLDVCRHGAEVRRRTRRSSLALRRDSRGIRPRGPPGEWGRKTGSRRGGGPPNRRPCPGAPRRGLRGRLGERGGGRAGLPGGRQRPRAGLLRSRRPGLGSPHAACVAGLPRLPPGDLRRVGPGAGAVRGHGGAPRHRALCGPVDRAAAGRGADVAAEVDVAWPGAEHRPVSTAPAERFVRGIASRSRFPVHRRPTDLSFLPQQRPFRQPTVAGCAAARAMGPGGLPVPSGMRRTSWGALQPPVRATWGLPVARQWANRVPSRAHRPRPLPPRAGPGRRSGRQPGTGPGRAAPPPRWSAAPARWPRRSRSAGSPR